MLQGEVSYVKGVHLRNSHLRVEAPQWWAKDETTELGLSLLPDTMLEKPGCVDKRVTWLRSSVSLHFSAPGI